MVLDFNKPKKLRSADEHNGMYQSDSGVAGTFVPNMSSTDRAKWKAKQIDGKDPRIEIRKTVVGRDPALKYPDVSTQVLLIVRKKGIVMSANGRIAFDEKTWLELQRAVGEAQTILQNTEK
jgi:hypothetical protein